MALSRFINKLRENASYIAAAGSSLGAALYGAYESNKSSHEASSLALNNNLTNVQAGLNDLSEKLYDFSRVQGITADIAVYALVFLYVLRNIQHKGAMNFDNCDLVVGRAAIAGSVVLMIIAGRMDGREDPQDAVVTSIAAAILAAVGARLIERNKDRTALPAYQAPNEAPAPDYQAIPIQDEKQSPASSSSGIIQRLKDHAPELVVTGASLGAALYGAFETNTTSHDAKNLALNNNLTDVQTGLNAMSDKLYSFSRIQGLTADVAIYAFFIMPTLKNLSLKNWDLTLGLLLHAAFAGLLVQAGRFDGQKDPQFAVITSMAGAGVLGLANMFNERYEKRRTPEHALKIEEVPNQDAPSPSAPTMKG